jgi:transcriptional regulator of aromatic amino acid metabolism
VKVNCATLPANLIESELFGHEKGAFTGAHARQLGRFEVANGASLFLDEIGELPLELQPKLLRVIQDGEFERLGSSGTIKVDVRLIAATNRNLEEEVRKGRFREDLWYRLSIFPIRRASNTNLRLPCSKLQRTFPVRNFNRSIIRSQTPQQAAGNALAIAVQGCCSWSYMTNGRI